MMNPYRGASPLTIIADGVSDVATYASMRIESGFYARHSVVMAVLLYSMLAAFGSDFNALTITLLAAITISAVLLKVDQLQ